MNCNTFYSEFFQRAIILLICWDLLEFIQNFKTINEPSRKEDITNSDNGFEEIRYCLCIPRCLNMRKVMITVKSRL